MKTLPAPVNTAQLPFNFVKCSKNGFKLAGDSLVIIFDIKWII
jgi:hypothetical protein